jgi:hypothetical protein
MNPKVPDVLAAAAGFLLLVGCSADASGPGGDASSPVDAATAGMCNQLQAEASDLHISCPMGQDCRDCGPVVAPGPIPDGRYVATQITLYASGCGSFASAPATWVLEVHGSTMDILSQLPVLSGGRMTVSYQIENDRIRFRQLCPTPQPGFGDYGPPGEFLVWPDHLLLRSPPGGPGPTVFQRR